jgi:hypothetical protein
MFILNCKKYSRKRLIQNATWTKEIGFPWFHVIGDPELTTEYAYDAENHILTVRCKDTYEKLPVKSYLAIRAIINLFPYVEYILKTDDDMKCNLQNLQVFINTDMRPNDYGGEFVAVNDNFSKYHYSNVEDELKIPFKMMGTAYCPGRFYFLSRRAADVICSSHDFFETQLFEDHSVGYIATRIPNGKYITIDAKSIFNDDTQ